MDPYYEVREYKYWDGFSVPGSTVIKEFRTKEEAKAFIEGLRYGSISGSMLVNDINQLFIECHE